MTAWVAVGWAVTALVAAVVIVHLVAKERSRGLDPGRPDRLTDDVVAGLMSEMRKWQAEAAHWKATAERLQRELDQRPGT